MSYFTMESTLSRAISAVGNRGLMDSPPASRARDVGAHHGQIFHRSRPLALNRHREGHEKTRYWEAV